MILRQLQFVQFRNHTALTFEPDDGINLIYGSNGSGKTSILEGIHYCSLTKGFISSYDSECVTFGTSYFLLKGLFTKESGLDTSVRVSYSRQTGKQLTVNKRILTVFSEHVGAIPCITFSPEDIAIVNGSPSERRRFIDNAICQTDPIYLDALIHYRRLLQQRNALLSQMSNKNGERAMLDVLTEQLSEKAAFIVHARKLFIEEIMPEIANKYGVISGGEHPTAAYRCSFFNGNTFPTQELMIHILKAHLNERRKEELKRGQTAAGPHRDDVLFYMNEKEIRKYASQGQKRSFVISLKLALYEYFMVKKKEKPICLFDDMFSELDTGRTDALLTILLRYGQTIITATEKKHASNIKQINIHDLL